MEISGRIIGPGQPVFIIAEIGINHNGDVGLAKRLIEAAAEAGADCVKFQKRHLKDVYKESILKDPNSAEQSFQYAIPILKEVELSDKDYKSLVAHCEKMGVIFNCTPWDRKSVDDLEKLGIPFYKIGSPDLTNSSLIRYVAKTRKPIIMSTGMSKIEEIRIAVKVLREEGAEFALLHCNSTYPAPPQEINLRFMETLRKEFSVPIGYSGHERGIAISAAAVALGACIIERHITMDKSMDGPDHKASLEPQEFSRMVQDIRDIEEALGTGEKHFSRGEVLSRDLLGKSLLASRDLEEGHVLTPEDIIAKSPGKGISPQRMGELVGKKLSHGMKKEDYFQEDDISPTKVSIPKSIGIKWGLKVRYNDIDGLMEYKPSLVEFHFTDKDLSLPVPKKKYPCELAVHAPEYYGHTLLDYCAEDPKVRQLSVEVLQKTIDRTNQMKRYFTNEKAYIIFHAGGGSIAPQKKKNPKLMERFLESLSKIKTDGVELLPENQVPRPWFYGGQWYINHFMEPEEIRDFCVEHGYHICFDIAHAMLFCNCCKRDLDEFIRLLLPFMREVHLADAYGINGEGTQIGEGDIDWKRSMAHFKGFRHALIPEIWRGHLQNGKEFVVAMNKLMPYLQ